MYSLRLVVARAPRPNDGSDNGRMASDIEKSIAAIPRVRSCRVVFNQDHEIDQVFVWADLQAEASETARLRQIKSLVRSVVGTVALKHDYDLDYRKVKILEYEPEQAEIMDTTDENPENEAAAALAGVNEQHEKGPSIGFDGDVRREAPRIQLIAAYVRYLAVPEIVVELNFLGETVVGRASVSDNVKTSAFNAFREAFEQLNMGSVRSVYVAELLPAFGQPKAIISKVQLTLPSNERFDLLGIAEEHGDTILSVVRACLDALNRKVTYPM